jgi:hypothetical protein
LAVQILQQEPSGENENIRNWAIEVINSYSDIPINEKTQTELKKIKIIPSQKFQPIVMDTKAFETMRSLSSKLRSDKSKLNIPQK